MKKMNRQDAYDKVVRTIKSCQDNLQLDTAINMMLNYSKLYKTSQMSLEMYVTIKLRELRDNRERRTREAMDRQQRIMDASS